MEFEKDISMILIETRTLCDKSQRDMAKLLGRSLGTIQSWEQGLSSPNFNMIVEWFKALNINPLRYFLRMINPEIYGLSENESNEVIKNAVCNYVQNVASEEELRKMAYSLFGYTGSSWLAQLELITAYNHLPLDRRINIAQSVLDSFLICQARQEIIECNHIMPNIDRLESAIKEGRKSVYQGMYGYSNIYERKE